MISVSCPSLLVHLVLYLRLLLTTVKAAFRSRQVTFELGQLLDPASSVDSQSKVYTQRAAAFDVQQPPAANRHWCICDNKKLSYRWGTARRAVSVETVQTVAQMFVGLHLISPRITYSPDNVQTLYQRWFNCCGFVEITFAFQRWINVILHLEITLIKL